ncbi:SRPBCC family protein [Umezawaea sp. Da 62-37]|uniref:SRPBCC family protein n=1 Tax=Umezawaea sp. Da 62-37 TaxID=3075927 RepID=UPI0028F73C17|nr:SRPBCC family protein [Umezawaea sp. Da 62-37]WNV87521.1 SRPBCC family protein [Umezawaea sp. Da 62-37]
MTTTDLEIPRPPDQVFGVLADGWSYAGWVVGATHIRDVDHFWPEVGTRIHHSVGAWPLQIEDETVVQAVDHGKSLELHAKLWPVGAARIRFDLAPTATGTRVTMTEKAVSGPGSLMPEAMQKVFLLPRNRETLKRLADLVVHGDQG